MNKNRNFKIIMLVLVFQFIFIFNLFAEQVKLTFFYTNDIHGNIKPYNIMRRDLEKPFLGGGFSIMKKYIDDYKKNNKNKILILVDAGDIFQGTPEGDLTDGTLVIETMNKMNYTAATLGNHEFDRGEDKLLKLIDKMKFAAVSANITAPSKSKLKKYAIKNFNNKIRIAFTGLLTTETKKILGAGALKKFDILDEMSSLKNVLNLLKKEKYDMLVLLSHCGTATDSAIVSEIGDFDVIFGGHDHSAKLEPLIVENRKTLVFSTYGRLSQIGQLEIDYDKKSKKIVNFKNAMIDLKEEIGQDKALQKFITEKSKNIDKIMNVKIGYSEIDLARNAVDDSYYSSSVLGNILTDVLREKSGAQIAFYNNSGIRSSIAAGTVKFRDAYQVEPFGNTIYTMKLKGSDIRQFISEVLNDAYHSVQISGLKIEYYQDASDSKFYLSKIVLDNGSLLNDAEYYLTATPNYIGAGNDGYLVFLKGIEKKDLLISILDSFVEKLKSNEKYNYVFKNRIEFIGIK